MAGSLNIRNVQTIKNTRTPGPDFGRILGEALEDVQRYMSNMGQAVVVNPDGSAATPPPINKLAVTAQDGIYQASITDNNNVYRGINYYLEYSPKSDFSNSHVVHLGPSRNTRLALGNQNLYFQAYSQYNAAGPASNAVAHTTNGNKPTVVSGGAPTAAYTGPAIPTSSGAGTNNTPLGGQGAGKIAYSQTSNGQPPLLS